MTVGNGVALVLDLSSVSEAMACTGSTIMLAVSLRCVLVLGVVLGEGEVQ